MLLRGREGLGISVRFFFPCYSFYFTGLYEMRGVLFGLARNLRSCRVWHVDMGRACWVWAAGWTTGGWDGRKEIDRSGELRIQLQTVSHIVGNKSTIESDV